MFIEVRGNYIVHDDHTRELLSEFNPGQPQSLKQFCLARVCNALVFRMPLNTDDEPLVRTLHSLDRTVLRIAGGHA